MFGSNYYTCDADLAAGKLNPETYAATILAELINRADAFQMLCEYCGDEVGGSIEELETAIRSFRDDVLEARARAMRAGLLRPSGDSGAWIDNASIGRAASKVDQVGGLLVPNVESEGDGQESDDASESVPDVTELAPDLPTDIAKRLAAMRRVAIQLEYEGADIGDLLRGIDSAESSIRVAIEDEASEQVLKEGE